MKFKITFQINHLMMNKKLCKKININLKDIDY